MRCVVAGVLMGLATAGTALAQAGLDTFGITRFYPTLPGTREWNSAHWANGIDRTIRYARDPYDPTDRTEDHSASTDRFRIDWAGMMSMSGGGIWEKVFELVDRGSWPVPGGTDGCSYTETHIMLPGNGTALMRTDGDGADYKMVSIREILPPGSTPVHAAPSRTARTATLSSGRLLLGSPGLRPTLGVARSGSD